MTSFVYRPDCPIADKNGFVEKSDYYIYLDLTTENKTMMRGNQRVSFHYIGDEMPRTRHMASGNYFTSKKKFRNETKAYGCIEVGNDMKVSARKAVKLDKRQRREDIKRAISELKNGRTV